MAPNISDINPTGVLYEEDSLPINTKCIGPSENGDILASTNVLPEKEYKVQLLWRNIIQFIYLHLASLYGVYLLFTSAKLATTIFAFLLYQFGATGVTSGPHRLWGHRAYKAKAPLKIILLFLCSVANQNSAFEWARDHRVHHKYSETNADPHNAKRGFFFSHMGWLMCRKHPDVIAKGKLIDISDLKSDKLLMFQYRYYHIFALLCCYVLPTVIPMYFWNESFNNSFFVATILRYTITLNAIWFVNSAAHMWGNRPYDKFINPAENVGVAIVAFGEGWHNYHHVFPWDYRTSELGNIGTYNVGTNFTTLFIDLFAKIGWAYDLKTVSHAMVKTRANRTGDGTYEDNINIWGWGDKDMFKEDVLHATKIDQTKSD